MPKYGSFLKTEHFGSKFYVGKIVKTFPEMPLHFLQVSNDFFLLIIIIKIIIGDMGQWILYFAEAFFQTVGGSWNKYLFMQTSGF